MAGVPRGSTAAGGRTAAAGPTQLQPLRKNIQVSFSLRKAPR